ncbi:MAG: TonB-dependent receptor [Acidobacteriota bacterium]
MSLHDSLPSILTRWLTLSVVALCCLTVTATRCGAQDMSTGSLNVTVLDPAGAFIPGASLVLKNLGTNGIHTVTTSDTGIAVIPYLNPANYSLTVTKKGFASRQYAKVTIQTNQVTSLSVTLQVGSTHQVVVVSAESSPILDTTSNTLETTIDLKQVEDLPTYGRDVSALAFLVPGAVDDDFNNLPGGAVNMSANGFSTMINRNKSGGFDTDYSSTSQRLEQTQEMTVETSELDASQGGTSAMDIGFLTKSGTNKFHGDLFEDYRSEDMNANSWEANAVGLPRSLIIINDFGADIGGPILKNKLFFFASLGNYRQPEQALVTTVIGTPLALSGTYIYNNATTNAVETTNVLQVGASAGCSTCSGTTNPLIAQDLANITSTESLPGVTISPYDANHNLLSFYNHESIIKRFPTARIDYDVSKNFRITGTAVESNYYYNNTGAPPYPGPLFSNQGTSDKSRNYQVVAGFDWILKPTLVNAFRLGYLYTGLVYDSQGIETPTPAMMQQGDLAFGFNLNSGINDFLPLKGGFLYPVGSIKDQVTWSHGNHNLTFGVEDSTEVDHYYNNQFVPYIGVNGISQGDPVETALTNAVANGPTSAANDVEGLYATLNGRMTYYSLGEFVNQRTKQFEPGITFDLHERLTQSALFVQDQWRTTPTLTLNMGLRWDFTGASKDETGFYTHPTIPDLWGPTPVGALFQPGNLSGVQDPVEGPHAYGYAPTYVHPEPTFGFAWNPRDTSDSMLGRLIGAGKSVIRGSFTFKNYTEGAQNFWSIGSNSGANFNTYFYADPVAPTAGFTPGPGFYNAGSVILGGSLPALTSTSPNPFQPIIPESFQTFSGTTYSTFNPNIKQPYIESWEFGIQRELSANNVLEVRYVGNVSKDQWLTENFNEVNIFENGFLTQFENAQKNLAASGGTTFQGPNPTPIFDQAFATSGLQANYTNGQFITYLQQGQAGAFANVLSSNSTYLCSMIGATFSPCAAQGIPGSGNYPSNFFQENPYVAGAGTLEMTNAGYTNYNALQVDFRQNMNHGMQFDANYTYSHSLGVTVQGSTAPGYYGGRSNSAPGFYTLRDERLNYFPSAFDVRHVFHASGTYDLPFGTGQPFLNQNRLLNSIVGGWTLGAIITYESGEPHLFVGGTSTFNQNDSGITLTNVTPSQLQSQMHARRILGKPYVSLFSSKYINQITGQSNTTYISPASTPGQFGRLLWLHDPTNFDTDLSLNKTIPIKADISFKFEGVFLNAFNHPSWIGLDSGVQDTTFGTTATPFGIGARQIELRANLQF